MGGVNKTRSARLETPAPKRLDCGIIQYFMTGALTNFDGLYPAGSPSIFHQDDAMAHWMSALRILGIPWRRRDDWNHLVVAFCPCGRRRTFRRPRRNR